MQNFLDRKDNQKNITRYVPLKIVLISSNRTYIFICLSKMFLYTRTRPQTLHVCAQCSLLLKELKAFLLFPKTPPNCVYIRYDTITIHVKLLLRSYPATITHYIPIGRLIHVFFN